MTGPPLGPRAPTRRSVLRTCGAGLGLGIAAGTAAVGSAQTDEEGEGEEGEVLEEGVIVNPPNIEQEVTGFWIHIGGTVDPLEASVSDQCGFVDWGDEETLAYDAMLIDRTAEPQQQSISLYLHESVDISPGTLFIINSREQCESGYVGVRLERVGMDLGTIRAAEPASPTGTVDDGDGGASPTDTPDGGGGGAEGPASGQGPGFGAVGALASLGGVGWLLRKRGGE